jgi:hypothetical protein
MSSQKSHHTSMQTRPRSYSYLNPPPQYSPLPQHHAIINVQSHTTLSNPIPNKRRLPPIQADYEKRPVPKRESLTQWKAERDEAKAEVVGTRKEHMKERVRRANELEQERERELMKLGKGTAIKEKERGCFGGFLGMLGLGGG